MALLTVSEIRREIWRMAGAAPAGGAGAEAGRLFHATVAEALGGESPSAWFRYFDPARLGAPDAADSYARTLYEEALGPAVSAQEAAFHAQPEALLRLWIGVKHFCAWLVGALRECEARGVIRWQGRGGWQGPNRWRAPNCPCAGWRAARSGAVRWKSAARWTRCGATAEADAGA